MTTAEKLTMLKTFLGISDTSQDGLLNAYLDFSKKEIISWRYGYSKYPNIAKATNSYDTPISVSATMFSAAISPTTSNSYTFTYSDANASWQYNGSNVDLSEYGLLYPEYVEPVDAETIIVKYNESYLAEFDTVQVMACVAGFNLSGAENQKSHSENGINRSFRYADMLEYIRDNVPPYCGVII